MFYSPQNGGFYSLGLHGDKIPSDAVEITQEKPAELLAGQSEFGWGNRASAGTFGFGYIVIGNYS